MSWIKIIPPQEANGDLKSLYEKIASVSGHVDHIMQAHSLMPHTMRGHMELYKNTLHHSANRLSPWFREALGLYVSLINHCEYCADHHAAGMARFLKDRTKAQQIRLFLEKEDLTSDFTARETAALFYARALTRAPSELTEDTIENLRTAGWEDCEILEINQIVSYFAYANRTVLGLGVRTDGEPLGESPSGKNDNWEHR